MIVWYNIYMRREPILNDIYDEIKNMERNMKAEVKSNIEEELSELKEFLSEEEFEKAVLEESNYRYTSNYSDIEGFTKSLVLLNDLLETFKHWEDKK